MLMLVLPVACPLHCIFSFLLDLRRKMTCRNAINGDHTYEYPPDLHHNHRQTIVHQHPASEPPTPCPLLPVCILSPPPPPMNRTNPSRSRPTADRKPENGPHDPTNRPELTASRAVQPGQTPHSDSYCRSYCPPRTEHPSPLKPQPSHFATSSRHAHTARPSSPTSIVPYSCPQQQKKPATSPSTLLRPSRTIQDKGKYNSEPDITYTHTPPSPSRRRKGKEKESACRLRHVMKNAHSLSRSEAAVKRGAPSHPSTHSQLPTSPPPPPPPSPNGKQKGQTNWRINPRQKPHEECQRTLAFFFPPPPPPLPSLFLPASLVSPPSNSSLVVPGSVRPQSQGRLRRHGPFPPLRRGGSLSGYAGGPLCLLDPVTPAFAPGGGAHDHVVGSWESHGRDTSGTLVLHITTSLD